jgi:hypothetical protein
MKKKIVFKCMLALTIFSLMLSFFVTPAKAQVMLPPPDSDYFKQVVSVLAGTAFQAVVNCFPAENGLDEFFTLVITLAQGDVTPNILSGLTGLGMYNEGVRGYDGKQLSDFSSTHSGCPPLRVFRESMQKAKLRELEPNGEGDAKYRSPNFKVESLSVEPQTRLLPRTLPPEVGDLTKRQSGFPVEELQAQNLHQSSPPLQLPSWWWIPVLTVILILVAVIVWPDLLPI